MTQWQSESGNSRGSAYTTGFERGSRFLYISKGRTRVFTSYSQVGLSTLSAKVRPSLSRLLRCTSILDTPHFTSMGANEQGSGRSGSLDETVSAVPVYETDLGFSP